KQLHGVQPWERCRLWKKWLDENHQDSCSHIKMDISARWRQIPGFVANFAVINAGIVVKRRDAME
ncbi:hypothetical protein, partial [Pseudomonas sp. 58 R 12]|uniref:hypothetical protein n=1 Tax=Pseudomonas sp. 58 R 12 TaxID=1844107 RepID=UPI001C46254C